MDDFKRIYERIDIRQLRTFLLYGAEDSTIDMRTYEQLLNDECKPLYKRLENLYPNEQDRNDFMNDISQALIAHEQVYMEIGMKAGAKLILQLLQKPNEII